LLGGLADLGFGPAGAMFDIAKAGVDAVDGSDGEEPKAKSESSYSMGDGQADWVFSPD